MTCNLASLEMIKKPECLSDNKTGYLSLLQFDPCSMLYLTTCILSSAYEEMMFLISIFVIQWIDDVLSKGNRVDFFYDEYRCPVFVKDVVAVIISLTTKWIAGEEIVFRH